MLIVIGPNGRDFFERQPDAGVAVTTKDNHPSTEKDYVSPRASAERDLPVHVKDARDVLLSCGKVWMHACNEMNELSVKNPGEILSMFSSKHKSAESLDNWLDTFVSTDPHVFKMNMKVFHCVQRTVNQDKLGFAEQTVCSPVVNDLICKLFHDVNCKCPTDVNGLIVLTINVCTCETCEQPQPVANTGCEQSKLLACSVPSVSPARLRNQ